MRFPYATSAIGLAWIATAWTAPETNFFLFPFVIGVSIPLVHRIAQEGAASQREALAMGTAGFVNASIITLMLSFTGKLAGEPLGWLGSTLIEGLVLGLAGGILGAAIARTP
jgi:hypothetical protein